MNKILKMMMNFTRKYFLISMLMLLIAINSKAQMTPFQAIERMTCGINVGRSLELAVEGEAGGRYIQEYYFTDFKTAGFDFVRIPIQWDQHTGTTAPYTVNVSWLNRVEQVIDWSLKHGLIAIINTHHDDWILENSNYSTNDLSRFKAIWTQVSERFKDKSDSLIFEIANEPNIAIEKTDLLNSSAIPIIRSTNPTRLIVFGGSGTQMSTLKKAKIPIDNYLIASIHSYLPWDFAGNGNGTWGTIAEINVVKALMVEADAWSKAHNIPILLGEFGTVGKCEVNSRMKWFYRHLEEARKYNIAPAVWQDFGNFSVYFHTTNVASKWTTVIKDIIVYTHPLSADALSVSIVSTKDAQLTWTNRASGYKWIRVERKLGTGTSGTYQTLATINGDATIYQDATTVVNATYTYRIVSELSTGEITASYPVEKKIVAVTGISVLDKFPDEYFAYFKGDELIINTDVKTDELFYRIFSLAGNIIKSGSLHANQSSINAESLSKGIYFVNIYSKRGVYKTTKVVNY